MHVFRSLFFERRTALYFRKWVYEILFHPHSTRTRHSKNVCLKSIARFMFVSSIRRLTYHSVVQLSVICHVPVVLSFDRRLLLHTPSVGFRREENTAGNCTICTFRLVRRDVSRVSTYIYLVSTCMYLQRCRDCGKTGRRRP